MSDPDRITAPWDNETVAALNRWQKAGFVHPFTCPEPHSEGRNLVAEPSGWMCPRCAYRQNWAHRFMTTEPINPFNKPRS